MKLCVLTVPYNKLTLEETLKTLSERGVQAVELGAGGYPSQAHLNVKELLADDKKINEVKSLCERYDIEIAALACHGNPVHPDKAIADKFHNEFIDAILLCEKLGVDTIVGFSGCPGDSETSQRPNWVTCSWLMISVMYLSINGMKC